MTQSLERKLGESLVRTLIKQLDERITLLERQLAEGSIGPRTFRARQRWAARDFHKLECVARRYGFNV